MSTKNYDSSLLTQRKQAKSLALYAKAIYVANNGSAADPNPTGAIRTVRTTQPTDQRAYIVTEQRIGLCYCDISGNYGFNPSGGQCGCGLGAS